jgi:glycosyltransferase involved in cell wall biosynthesis
MNELGNTGRGNPSGPAPRLLLSVTLPVFNEQEVIEATHRRVISVLGNRPDFDLEIVYVDDGSRDRTPLLLSGIADNDARICVVSLTRNFGQQAAITAGLRHCLGDAIAVLDADLQDPPEIVLEMLAKWREGYSVVYGIRKRQEVFWRRWLYSTFYRVFSALSDVPIPADSGDFCVIDRQAADALNGLQEKRRFVRALRAWYGGRQYGLTYQRERRAAGRTKYSLAKYLDMATDSIFSFSARPLRLLALIGFLISLASLMGFLFAICRWLGGGQAVGPATAAGDGTTTLTLGLLLLSGVQLLSLGILGGYLGRIYMESKARPAYLTASLRPSLYRTQKGRPVAGQADGADYAALAAGAPESGGAGK